MGRHIEKISSGLTPVGEFPTRRTWKGHAAILVPLAITDKGFSLLLTKRAHSLRHHGGEVAFPGGMWEEDDQFPVATALRESEEEIALSPHCIEVLGLLPTVESRHQTEVKPVVGLVERRVNLAPNPAEIDSVFWVPMDELLADRRIRTDVYQRGRQVYWAPAYRYQGYEIWGLTAWVIRLLMKQCFDVRLERPHSAPEFLVGEHK